MSRAVPGNFKLVFSSGEIAARARELGKEITAWSQEVWNRSRMDLVAVPVLRGGIFFFADLVREIEASVETAPVKTSAYLDSAAALPEVTVELGKVPAEGRQILLVDDVCDSGRTLAVLRDAFLKAGAIEVRSVALIQRRIEKPIFHPEWVGFQYDGPEWFVGYGMDDSNRWRNLPEVYVIQQEKDS